MRNYFLIAMVLVPLLAAAAAPEQRYEVEGDSWGFPGEDAGTGAYLGVDISDVSAERVSALKLPREQGVEVTMVDQDAPAGKAGIREHDVILSMNGTAVDSGAQLRRMIHETPADRVITLGISREGKPMNVQVKLAERKVAFKMPSMPRVNVQDMDIPVSVVVVHSALRSGLMIENLTPQLGEFFGAKDGRGVLVRSVERGSRAEKAGFRAGDVIVRVDKEPVRDASDFSSALRSRHNTSGAVAIGVIRDKKEQTLTLTLPPQKQSGDLFESFAFPDVDIDAHVDLQELNTQLENIQPEIAFANMKPQVDKAMQEARREMQQAKKQWCLQEEELRKQQRGAQKEMRRGQQQLQKQMQDQSRRLRDEMNRKQDEVRRELREWQMGTADI